MIKRVIFYPLNIEVLIKKNKHFLKVLGFIFEGLSVFTPSVKITRHDEAVSRKKEKKTFEIMMFQT